MKKFILTVYLLLCAAAVFGAGKAYVYVKPLSGGADRLYRDAVRANILSVIALEPDITGYSDDAALEAVFRDDAALLGMDRVSLIARRRGTGVDGVIAGELNAIDPTTLELRLSLVNLASGKVAYSGTFRATFGMLLFREVETRVADFLRELVTWYSSTLTVVSDPDGAEVFIAGASSGFTPLKDIPVPEGETTVTVKKQGYLDHTETISAAAGRNTVLDAVLRQYVISITSDPPGAAVSVNGKPAGRTPVTDLSLAEIAPAAGSKIKVEAKLDGYAPFSGEYPVVPGRNLQVHAELYDLVTRHYMLKENGFRIDAHEAGYGFSLNANLLGRKEPSVIPSNDVRYGMKLDHMTAGAGFNFYVDHFSTGIGTPFSDLTVNESTEIPISSLYLFAQYNLFESLNRLEIYAGAGAGGSFASFSNSSYPEEYTSCRSLNPFGQAELGVTVGLAAGVRVTLFGGFRYYGTAKFFVKDASDGYWGETGYVEKTGTMMPFYAGLSLSYRYWPSIRAGR